MFAAEERGKLPKGTALRWVHHTPNSSALPEYVNDKDKKGRKRNKAAACSAYLIKAAFQPMFGAPGPLPVRSALRPASLPRVSPRPQAKTLPVQGSNQDVHKAVSAASAIALGLAAFRGCPGSQSTGPLRHDSPADRSPVEQGSAAAPQDGSFLACPAESHFQNSRNGHPISAPQLATKPLASAQRVLEMCTQLMQAYGSYRGYHPEYGGYRNA